MKSQEHPSHDLEVKKLERLSATRVRLALEFPPSVVESHQKMTANRYLQIAKIPGFRPGKAPLKMVMEKYRDDITNDVVTHLVEAGLQEACQKNNLTPISRPRIQMGSAMTPDKPFAFQAEFDIEPEIDLKKYKGVPLKKAELEVGDAEVDATIENLRERLATLEPFEATKPEKGCYGIVEVGFDLIGSAKTEAPKTFTVELGAGSLLPELETGLMEMTVGEQRHINAKFPESYDDKNLAGKEATFHCKILELKKKVLPELNDAFAGQLKANGNLEDLKKEIREGLLSSKRDEQKKTQRSEIVDYLIAHHPFEVPQTLVEGQMQSLIRWMQDDLKKRGQNLSELKPEEMEMLKKRAEQMVKSSLLLKEIAVKEKIELDSGRYQERLQSFASQVNRSVEETEKLLSEKGILDRIRDEIMTDQVFDFLVQNAELVEGAPRP